MFMVGSLRDTGSILAGPFLLGHKGSTAGRLAPETEDSTKNFQLRILKVFLPCERHWAGYDSSRNIWVKFLQGVRGCFLVRKQDAYPRL